jgi:hypothetical protein
MKLGSPSTSGRVRKMGLTMKERKPVVRELVARYRIASKKQKSEMLDEVIRLTGHNRCYASQLLRHPNGLSRGKDGGIKLKKRRIRRRFFDDRVHSALKQVWVIMDCICGKRLAPILKEIVGVLVRNGELRVKAETREKLERISASTIDRLLSEEKRKLVLGSRSRTKPGTLLKSQIPIRTFSEWNDARPGFVEIDLVGHDGGDGTGDFAQTLDVTDVSTGWTETRAVRNKAQVHVLEALVEIRQRLPFQLLGVDSDNGSEFINSHLLKFCVNEEITFTRSRSGRKNDNCFVEQKNYSVVRRNVGYLRHDTEQEVELLNLLYEKLRLYSNYFQPVMKLISKERVGAQVRKKYDLAQTPYHRLLASSDVSRTVKHELRTTYEKLNPAALKREITQIQDQLISLATSKQKTIAPGVRRRKAMNSSPSQTHPWRRRLSRQA